jgi:protein-tyrosine phosphatase
MTELIPNLFIGNWHEAKVHSMGMYVVTVAHDSPFVGEEHFKLVDGPGNDPDVLIAAAEAVWQAYSKGLRVLVHCHGGRSRSGAVAVIAVMKILDKRLCEAYDFVKDKHEITRIHPYLSEILLGYEMRKK